MVTKKVETKSKPKLKPKVKTSEPTIQEVKNNAVVSIEKIDFPVIKIPVSVGYDANYIGIRRTIQQFNFLKKFERSNKIDDNEILYEKPENKIITSLKNFWLIYCEKWNEVFNNGK